MKSMPDYNLLDCSEMGIADHIRNTKMMVPKWMNDTETAAYKVGFNRAKEQCKPDHSKKYR